MLNSFQIHKEGNQSVKRSEKTQVLQLNISEAIPLSLKKCTYWVSIFEFMN